MPFALDQEEAVDGLIQQRAHGADLQHVVDVDAVGGQRHHLEHLDHEDVGRLDLVDRQRDHAQFARRAPIRAARAVAARSRRSRRHDSPPARQSPAAAAEAVEVEEQGAIMGISLLIWVAFVVRATCPQTLLSQRRQNNRQSQAATWEFSLPRSTDGGFCRRRPPSPIFGVFAGQSATGVASCNSSGKITASECGNERKRSPRCALAAKRPMRRERRWPGAYCVL